MNSLKPEILLKNSDSDKEKWLELRCDYINSTESSALFGLSKYSSPFELWHIKKDKIIESFDNERMAAGRFLEPSIAKFTLDKIGCNGTHFKQYLRHPVCRLASSFDWKITSGEYKGWLLEIKNVDKWIYKDNWSEFEAPTHIEIQVQHQLAVSGRKGAVIAALVGGNELKLIFRKRNNDMCNMIISATNEFWESQEKNIEPVPNFETDSNFICKLRKESGGEPFIATNNDYISSLIEEDDTLKEAAKKIGLRRTEIKAECFTLIEKSNEIIIDGIKRRSCTTTKDTLDSVITEDMVGNIKKGRKGFRNFR